MVSYAELRQPTLFTAEYAVYYNLQGNDIKAAKIIRTLSAIAPGQYQFHSKMNAIGIARLIKKDMVVEVSRWQQHADFLRPLHYSYRRTKSKKNRSVDVQFSWDKQQIAMTVNGSSWHMPIHQEHILDKLLYELAIMYDLQRGVIPQQYIIADGGQLKNYQLSLLEEDEIDTPMGQLRSIKLSRKRADSARKTVFWCAPGLDYLPVKVQFTETNGKTTTILIQSYTPVSPANDMLSDTVDAAPKPISIY